MASGFDAGAVRMIVFSLRHEMPICDSGGGTFTDGYHKALDEVLELFDIFRNSEKRKEVVTQVDS
ncbi:MAG: hypothetical protein HZA04_02535 [Nitrospinae bacterium]|nr:hypothetical protein [Nitrospinota bacterium]